MKIPAKILFAAFLIVFAVSCSNHTVIVEKEHDDSEGVSGNDGDDDPVSDSDMPDNEETDEDGGESPDSALPDCGESDEPADNGGVVEKLGFESGFIALEGVAY